MKHSEHGNQRYITGILGELYVMFHVSQRRQILPIYWRYKHKQSEIDFIYQITPKNLIFIEVRSVIVSCETGYSDLGMARMMSWKKKAAIIKACAGYVIRETGNSKPCFQIICAVVALDRDLNIKTITFQTIYRNI